MSWAVYLSHCWSGQKSDADGEGGGEGEGIGGGTDEEDMLLVMLQVDEARAIRAEEEQERQWDVQQMKAGWLAQEAEAVAKERARRAHQQQLQEEVEVFNR